MGPIARGQITLVDLSDIISQSTAPANPTEGMLWMNTGATPPVLMVYRGGKWVQQNDFKEDPEYNIIKETIKTNSSGIDVLKDEIKLKVTQTEVTNTVVAEVGKAQAENEIKFTEINSKVADINIDLDGITSRVSSVESAQSEVGGQITDLTSRVQEAEQKITPEAIVSTVKNSQTNGKNTFAQTSDLEQTASSITASFKQSGGENLIYNSTGQGGIVNWTKSTDTGVSLGAGTNSNIGSGIKSYLYLDTGTIAAEKHAYSKRFEMAGGTKYTLSVWVHTYTKSKGLDIFLLSSTTLESTDTSTAYTNTQTIVNGANTNGAWKKYTVTFMTPANTRSAILRIDNNGYNEAGTNANRVHWNALTLTKGDLERPWSAHPSETYEGIVKLDGNGVEVSSTGVKSKTQMTSEGFCITKTDTNEKVFKVNADGTLALKGSMEITGGTVPGSLIVNGTIGADKIVATGITANKIKAGSLTATNGKSVFNLDTGAFNIGTTSDATYLKYDTTNGLDIKGKMTFSSGTVFPDSVLNDKIQVGGSNLVVASQIGISTGTGGSANITNYADNGTVAIQKANSTDGIYLETGSLVGESTKIVLAFKIKKLSGTLSNIGGHMDTGLTGSIVSIDGLDYSFPWNSPNTVATLNDGSFHEIKVILNYTKQSSTNPKLYIQPNRTLSTAVSVEIQELRLEKGTVSTSWTLSARDYQEAISNANSTANSANQTASKVESVLNGMTQVRPDGQTVIDGDKILTGSVKADKVELYNLVIKDIVDDSITTFNIDNSGSVSMKGSVQSINFDDTEGSAKGFKLTADGKAYLNEAIVDGEVRLPNAGVTNGKIAVPSGPMFSFIDDDGRFTTRDMIKPYFDQAGIKGCSAVITDYVGSDPSFLNVNDLKTLQNDGWDILCHSKTTDTVTPSIHYYVCEESRKWMDNNGFNGANIFVYPNGNLGEDAPEVERVVGEYFDYAFNITGSYNIEPYPNKMNMSRVVIDDQNTINSPFIQKIIKDTFENNGWCVFYFHSATTNSSGDYTFNVENLMSIINNIKEQGGKIVTVTEALAERNVIKDSSIRFWAGANYANRDNAPFRVLHNGEIIATKGRFEGITSGTFNLSDMLTIDKVNGYRHYGVDISDLRNEISLINTSFSTNFSVKNLAGSDAFAVNLEGVGSTTVGTETFSVGSQFKVSNESTNLLALGEKTKHLLYYEKSSNTNRLNIKSNNPNSSTDFRFEKDTGNAIVEIAGELNVTEAVQIDKVRMVKRTSDATNYGIDFIIL